MAYASSTDCVGPLAKSIEDIRIVLNVMSGKDPKDQTSIASSEISEESIATSAVKTVGYFTGPEHTQKNCLWSRKQNELKETLRCECKALKKGITLSIVIIDN